MTYQKKIINMMLEYIEDTKDKDDNLVIMAPTTETNGFRVYSNGGLLAEIKKTKTDFLKNEGYKKYIKGVFETEKIDELSGDCNYDDFKKYVENCTKVTKIWAQTHYERKMENDIIHYYRNNNKICFLDMEFFVETGRYGGVTNYGNGTPFNERGGRVDLVVYDQKKGFGLIELKYFDKNRDNASMGNIGKHFGDFEAVVNGDKKEKIVAELDRRLRLLIDAGVIKIPDDETSDNSKKDLWYGFLLLGDSEENYKNVMKDKSNWNCMESHKNKKYWVNWEDLKEAYKNGEVSNPGRYIWFKDYKDKGFQLSYDDMNTFDFF